MAVLRSPETPASPALTQYSDAGDGAESTASNSTVMTMLSSNLDATVINSNQTSTSLDAALRTADIMKHAVARKGAHPPRSCTPPRKKEADGSCSPTKSSIQQRKKSINIVSDEVDEDVDLQNVLHFCCWGKDTFKVLYELFRFPDATCKYISCRSVPVDEFVAYIYRNGFKGDCISIVSEIQKCAPKSVANDPSQEGAPAREITMSMLQKFIRMNAHLTSGLEWSPVNEFKKRLRDSRSCYLRAWRLDIDRFATGTVPYMTFIQACHKLQHGHLSQAIWNSFRPDATTAPLEFAEFAPEEASNLENFMQMLWVTCAFDMSKAWEVIDVTQRLWVTEAEFVEGVGALGFQGDASQIYRGLDTYGMGHLWKRELEYLKVLFHASCRTPHGTPQIKILRTWVKAAFGKPEVFLHRLGMTQSSDVKLSPLQLSSGLSQLNYPGDSSETAHFVARAAGIEDGITRELLLPLLTGERPAAPPYVMRTIKSFKEDTRSATPKRTRSTPPSKEEREKSWNGAVDDLCLLNDGKPIGQRSFFSYERSIRSGETPPPRVPRSKTPLKIWTESKQRSSFKVEPPPEEDKVDDGKKEHKKEKKHKRQKTPGEGEDDNDDEGKRKKEKKEKRDKKTKKEKKEIKDDNEDQGSPAHTAPPEDQASLAPEDQASLAPEDQASLAPDDQQSPPPPLPPPPKEVVEEELVAEKEKLVEEEEDEEGLDEDEEGSELGIDGDTF